MLVTCFSIARRQAVERIVGATAAEKLGDDLRVEHRAARVDAAQRVEERIDVGDPVLEEVADALGAVLQQLHRVALVDVLREHHEPDLGHLAPDLLGGAQALVGLRRRHPNVGDRHVGAVGANLAQSSRRSSAGPQTSCLAMNPLAPHSFARSGYRGSSELDVMITVGR